MARKKEENFTDPKKKKGIIALIIVLVVIATQVGLYFLLMSDYQIDLSTNLSTLTGIALIALIAGVVTFKLIVKGSDMRVYESISQELNNKDNQIGAIENINANVRNHATFLSQALSMLIGISVIILLPVLIAMTILFNQTLDLGFLEIPYALLIFDAWIGLEFIYRAIRKKKYEKSRGELHVDPKHNHNHNHSDLS